MTKPGGISMDWIELFADDRKRLTKLFAECPGLHGCITAVLQGGTGAVFRQGVLGGVFVCRRKERATWVMLDHIEQHHPVTVTVTKSKHFYF